MARLRQSEQELKLFLDMFEHEAADPRYGVPMGGMDTVTSAVNR